jgi:PKD repeat protein
VTRNGSPYASGSGASWSFATLDEGTYQVTVSATDDGGMTGSTSMTVIGTDVTPAARITGVSASPSLVIAPLELLSFSGAFSDPGPQDWHVATWDFGDGTTLTTPQIPAGGSTSLSASHSYAAAGTYTVHLKVADDDGTTGVATTTVTVQTAGQALAAIAAYVQGLGLNKGETNSLLAKLNAASDAAGRGDTNAANNELNAFLNELSADVSSGKISPASASLLSASVHAVQGALGTRNRFTDWWPLGL